MTSVSIGTDLKTCAALRPSETVVELLQEPTAKQVAGVIQKYCLTLPHSFGHKNKPCWKVSMDSMA